MRISQVLQRKTGGAEVVTVTGDTPVRTALAQLIDRRIGAVVVSGDGHRVDGVLSERDVARGLHEHGAAVLDAPVSGLMTGEVHTCGPDSTVLELAELMTEHRVRHVPVVVAGQLTGLVSIGDVVKARLDELESERAALVEYLQTS